MSISFCSFSSGSSGNCYLISSKETKLLLDVGIPGRDIIDRLDYCGVKPEEIDGIFITHEHSDHIKSLRMMSKATEAKIYATQGTLSAVKDRLSSEAVPVESELWSAQIGDIKVESFPLSHDALDPAGFSFSQGDIRITVITDTGKITREQRRFLLDSDIIALEANHERSLLMYTSYPFTLKRRILSDDGHLSNDAAAECIADILKNRTKKTMPLIALSHISKDSNSPEMALLTVKGILEEKGYYLKKDYLMTALYRDRRSEIFKY